LARKLKAELVAEMLRPVSMRTSAKEGVIGPGPNKKALRVSDQKCEAAMCMDSFLVLVDKESSMH
jgi:hypothetical protein